VNNMLQNMSVDDSDKAMCANCGKEGANNTCNKCNQVKYCNAVCKKVHKKKHKKECEEHVRLAAKKHNEELRIAAELHDEKLFEQPPPEYGDCPICFLRMPTLITGSRYQACCGKMICSGCFYAPVYDNQGNEIDSQKCAFCRTPTPTSDEESIRRLMKRVEAGDPEAIDTNDPFAIYNSGSYYRDGLHGFPRDYTKALELWHRAAELGIARAYVNIGVAHYNGRGVEVDMKKATHYYEVAAIGGCVNARRYLGNMEKNRGNMERALKHFMIAVRGGDTNSLKEIKELYSNGHATKEDYTKALQLYQEYLGEIKTDQRDKAAAAEEECRYY